MRILLTLKKRGPTKYLQKERGQKTYPRSEVLGLTHHNR